MFLRLGSLIAWLALILGTLRVGIGFFVASIDDAESRAAMASRYLGSASSGEAIDQGLVAVVFGVVLGILVKIGRSVSR
ncbi:MAG TPA: hypothetical protein VNS12_13290 [Pelagibacterium sp.]|uniref:hypothetical protein n=1 Tax=Pelagibacterium sp. TaxID=1967288 RepID=UPI002B729B38|nr:hypothetical protein [Pelagibacterium sp.]HWJ89037.1 hypothetical protein [Pelagibacterium sp.]